MGKKDKRKIKDLTVSEFEKLIIKIVEPIILKAIEKLAPIQHPIKWPNNPKPLHPEKNTIQMYGVMYHQDYEATSKATYEEEDKNENN